MRRIVCVALLVGAAAAHAQEQRPPGAEKSARTEVLEAGAVALQDTEPVDQLSIWLVGFHPMKDDPSHQMEAHHYCRQVNEDFAQCALFDGSSKDARLNGIEYIISEKLFEQLPPDERKYWHPHNYEILSGQLVAPGIPQPAEHRLMDAKMNSYGKTWHVWMSGDEMPFGDPHLAWSFNRDGEARPELARERDRKYEVNSGEIREKRQDLVSKARPQCGVGALAGKFTGELKPIPGVEQRQEGCPAP
ncbi:MAG: DUF1264 domain-containing protein [Proteobacteria bacterium]|nr:MAG: DUF1264 domain-containing protein [Pseudomonadota bacterium]